MYRSNGPIRIVVASALAALCLFATVAEAAPHAAETKTVTIQDFAFGPENVTVNVGDTVTWTNKDKAAHTATASDKSFDSGRLATDQAFSFTFTKAGSFSYVCAFHDQMAATIVVQEVGAAPAQPAPAQPAPASASKAALEAVDQPLVNGGVSVKEVYADQDGWMVVHKDDNGNPGPVIGQTAVKQGETNNVVVKLSEPVATGAKLWPMLHVDAGAIGTYEFPGADVPAKDAAGMVVMKQITISATAAAPATLPTTGGETANTAVILAVALALLVAGALAVGATRQRKI